MGWRIAGIEVSQTRPCISRIEDEGFSFLVPNGKMEDVEWRAGVIAFAQGPTGEGIAFHSGIADWEMCIVGIGTGAGHAG